MTFCFIKYSFSISFIIPLIYGSVDEYNLLQHLKENYDYFERPVSNVSQPLDVKVRFLLNQILDVDEKNQVITLMAYIDYRWTDYKLHWDPEQFGGLKDVRFWGAGDAPFKLWKPDILLFNSVSESFDSTYSSRIIVNYDGTVQQNPPGILRFSCDLDVTYFPFDTQTCFLKFGSWTYSGSYIDLDMIVDNITGVDGHKIQVQRERAKNNPDTYYVNESMDLQVYVTNGEFDLLATPGKRVVTFFDKESYHELYFFIQIRRKTLAYGINLIIPSLVISIMTVLGFTLPPDACEKVTLETTILLSVIFFLQMLANMSPTQSLCVPILASFFSCCLLVVACSCVFTVLILSMHHRKPETHHMTPLMRRVFLDWLPYILVMPRPHHPKTPKAPKVIDKTIMPTTRLHMVPMLALPRPSTTMIPIPRKTSENAIHLMYNTRYFDIFCRELTVINKELKHMSTAIQEQFKADLSRSEWKFAAMAVDRACLFLFTLFISISTCGLILPHVIAAGAT